MVKAAVISEPEKLEVKNFDLPKVAEDAMLVRIKACGVCGTDVHVFHGHRKTVPFPLIPGHELSGVVEELGPDANKRLKVHGGELGKGDMVTVVPGVPCGRCFYCRNTPDLPNLCMNRLVYGVTRSAKDPPHLYGGYSEHLYVEPGSWVYKLPKDMSFEMGALAEPMAVSSRALSRALGAIGKATGMTVLVQGAGPIGLLATAAAKVMDAEKVIVIDRVEERLQMAMRMGADEVIDMRELETSEARVKRTLELTDGVGADVVVECTGVPTAVPEGIEMTRRAGKYVEVGHFTDPGGVEIRPHVICHKDMDILGSWVYPMWQFGDALKVLNSRKFPFVEIFTHHFSIDEALQAIQASERGECIKAMITP
jgi:L-iditol 2-dehydrogenase